MVPRIVEAGHPDAPADAVLSALKSGARNRLERNSLALTGCFRRAKEARRLHQMPTVRATSGEPGQTEDRSASLAKRSPTHQALREQGRREAEVTLRRAAYPSWVRSIATLHSSPRC
jgi:hypothetical protein